MTTSKNIDLSVLLQDGSNATAIKTTTNQLKLSRNNLLNTIKSTTFDPKFTGAVTFKARLLILHIFDSIDTSGRCALTALDLCDELSIHRTTINKYIDIIKTTAIYDIKSNTNKTIFTFTLQRKNQNIKNIPIATYSEIKNNEYIILKEINE